MTPPHPHRNTKREEAVNICLSGYACGTRAQSPPKNAARVKETVIHYQRCGSLAVLVLATVARLAAAQVTITEYGIPTIHSGPVGITAGPDGNLWFTEFRGNQIGKVTTGGSFTEYSIPSAGSFPTGISVGPDSNLWFTEQGVANNIGRVNLPTGTPTPTRTPTATPTPFPSTVLSAGIGANDTCIPVADASLFSPTGGYALIGSELISYTALGTSCSEGSVAAVRAGTSATAGVLMGVVRNLNGQGGAHAGGTPITPTVAPGTCIGDCDGGGRSPSTRSLRCSTSCWAARRSCPRARAASLRTSLTRRRSMLA